MVSDLAPAIQEDHRHVFVELQIHKNLEIKGFKMSHDEGVKKGTFGTYI